MHMFNIFSRNNKSLIDAKTLQAILDETLSSRLERIGLTKGTNYCWHEQALKEIRRGISYVHLKGASGTFTWGVNLAYLPTVSNGKIAYHKSAKKYLHHLFEWTDEYASSFFGGQLAGGVTTHFGLKAARKSIVSLIDKYEEKIISWFDKAISVEDLIDVAERQVNIGKYYKIHSPAPRYVLAFLYARANQIDLATKHFEELGDYEFGNNREVREKLKTKLLMLAEGGAAHDMS
jgi:hypothetical protein